MPQNIITKPLYTRHIYFIYSSMDARVSDQPANGPHGVFMFSFYMIPFYDT
jgi:hypothetical protein